MTTADDAAQAEAERRWPSVHDTGNYGHARYLFRAGATWQRGQRPDLSQREAVARALFGACWNGPYVDGMYAVTSPIGRAYAEADAVLAALSALTPVQPDRPDVVVLCGSTRFRAEMAEANRDLTFEGAIVVAPGVFGHSGDEMTEGQKVALDRLHFHKIDLADRVLVVSPGGYVGESTRREIDYAERTGKPVAYRQEFAPVQPDPLRAWVDRLRGMAEHNAITARARGWSEAERQWLDVLAIIERAETEVSDG